jgi:hypothetical protein
MEVADGNSSSLNVEPSKRTAWSVTIPPFKHCSDKKTLKRLYSKNCMWKQEAGLFLYLKV